MAVYNTMLEFINWRILEISYNDANNIYNVAKCYIAETF